MTPSRRALVPDLAAIIVISIWGTNFVFLKVALEEFDVLPFMFLRYLGMLALGWFVLLALHRLSGIPLGIDRVDLPRFTLAGLLGYSIYILLSTYGLSYTTAFSNALLIATAPLFMAGLLAWQRLEPIVPGQVAAMLVALTGVFVFMLDKTGAGFGTGSAGDLISLAAAFFFAAFTVTTKPLLARYPATAVTSWTLTIGSIPVLILSLPSLAAQEWDGVSDAAWLTLGWSIAAPVYLAWTVWSWVNNRVGVARTSLFMYLVPFVGGITSWLLLDEEFGMQKIVGSVLVLTGLALARYVSSRQPRSEPEPAIIEIDAKQMIGSPHRTMLGEEQC